MQQEIKSPLFLSIINFGHCFFFFYFKVVTHFSCQVEQDKFYKLIVSFCYCFVAPKYTFMHEATKASKDSFFDYIVIGGDTDGIPFASTLSANYSVLLLEHDDSPYHNGNITSVVNFGRYFLDTFITEGVVNLRPRVLGGGTSTNAGSSSRGDEKIDVETRLTDEDLIEESYQWAEKVMLCELVVKSWQLTLLGLILLLHV